jgi:hypothetical protein
VDFHHHWSGKRSLQEAVKELRGDVLYATVYRFTSQFSHASDCAAHVDIDSNDDTLTWEIGPTTKGFEAASYASRQLLWGAANRIDQRLGLGFSSTLALHKPSNPPS